jgi:hypothetical protein
MPGMAARARSIAWPACDDRAADTCRHADSCRHQAEKFALQTLFARALLCRDHMFSQALQPMAR